MATLLLLREVPCSDLCCGWMCRLTKMLINLDRHYNERFGYPVVIFHEGDFTHADQAKLQQQVSLNSMEIIILHVMGHSL
jgi:hypothetical protein